MKDKLKKIFLTRYDIPKAKLLAEAVSRFSLTEKIIFYGLGIVLTVGAVTALINVSESFMVEVPSHGGTLTEGIIGVPRFINPLLALSDADRDMTSLIYSGLLRATPEGTLLPDLAESYSLSADGLIYTFVLKKNLTFHDGEPVTADDVVFTIEKALDPAMKSPKRPNWEGTQVKKISDRIVELTLKQPYSPFLENATLGILPKHIWNEVPVEEFPFSKFNIEPVGSGPYKFKTVEKNSGNIPLYYQLEAFDRYTFGKPYIKNLTIRFYQNNKSLVDAYSNGSIDSLASISPQQASAIKEKNGRIERTPLPRIFGVFFNQNQATVLANKEVREALNIATNKQAIVNQVLDGYGIAIESPIPPSLLPDKTSEANTKSNATNTEQIALAKKKLESAGWKLNEQTGTYEKTTKKVVTELTFSISTSNAPELKATAEMLQAMWKNIGARVDIKIFDIGELNQTIIRTRKYDALLFGEIIGRDLDLFAFWHSSQRNDPGLNIALYTNVKADKLLEEAATRPTGKNVLKNIWRLNKKFIRTSRPYLFILRTFST